MHSGSLMIGWLARITKMSPYVPEVNNPPNFGMLSDAYNMHPLRLAAKSYPPPQVAWVCSINICQILESLRLKKAKKNGRANVY